MKWALCGEHVRRRYGSGSKMLARMLHTVLKFIRHCEASLLVVRILEEGLCELGLAFGGMPRQSPGPAYLVIGPRNKVWCVAKPRCVVVCSVILLARPATLVNAAQRGRDRTYMSQ